MQIELVAVQCLLTIGVRLTTPLCNAPYSSKRVVRNVPSVLFKTPAATQGSHQLPQGSPKQTLFKKKVKNEYEGLGTE